MAMKVSQLFHVLVAMLYLYYRRAIPLFVSRSAIPGRHHISWCYTEVQTTCADHHFLCQDLYQKF